MGFDRFKADDPDMETDNEIRRHARNTLRNHPDPDRTLVVVNVSSGMVILTGWVCSYFARQRAENIIATVPGIRGILNLLEVAAGGYTRRRHAVDTACPVFGKS